VNALTILAAALLVPAPVFAQSPGGASAPKQQPKPAEDPLQKKLDEKLKEPFFKKAAWLTDYDQALAESKKSGKPIFGYFSRSYAYCPPCHDLENSMLSEAAFAEWAKGYVLFCHITTKIAGRKNDDLLEKKGGQGFPHLVFMDADGDVLATHEGSRELDALDKTASAAKEALGVKAKAAAGDAEAKVEWFLRQLESGSLDAVKARTRVKELGTLTPEQSKLIEDKIFDLEVMAIASGIQQDSDVAEAAKKVLTFVEQKKLPKGDSAFEFCWQILCGHGQQAKDVKFFEAGLTILTDRYGENPRYRGMIAQIEKDLTELKKSAPASRPASSPADKKKP
jgi:hypothetical protein